MGLPHWLTRTISPQPIAIHFGSDVVRMMQIRDKKECALQSAVEVASPDSESIKIAFDSFKGKRCVVSIGSENVLVQHIRVSLAADEAHIREALMKFDSAWGDAEIRQICVTTTGGSSNPRQEILCAGVSRRFTREVVQVIESAGAEVIAVTVPLYASIRAFDRLYRRDGDEKITSLLIDMDEDSSIVMIAHGANCVFAHRIGTQCNQEVAQQETQPVTTPSLTPISSPNTDSFERREENTPRGLHGIESTNGAVDASIEIELEQCIRHHDALFPERAVDRVIFTGKGASETNRCAAIANHLGIAGFVADPAAWIQGAEGCAAGPSWTTVAGICIRYTEKAA
ncbi:MAG: hypothetical protein P8N28_02900 [Phycisphaerales bacterium]|nr:hypothetical protein [Phycisphaerales bacterium]